mmetsp:Transcript_35383/g.34415  ORF Transcript_35383/g.34415 Transcript_35383/m.34415 type:complete len:245 (-) Transcript_35383:17-751(-)
MRIDLAIIPLLDCKDKVYPTPLQDVLVQPEVPSRHLEHMDNVSGDLLDAWSHEISHIFHLPVFVSVLFHESFFYQKVHIEEVLLCGILLEVLGDLIIAITDEEHHEIFLLEVQFLFIPQLIVVVDDASQSILELLLLLIVHRDAHSHLRVLLFEPVFRLDLGYHAGVLDLPHLAIGPEATGSDLTVQLAVCQRHRLIRLVQRWLPLQPLDLCHVACVHGDVFRKLGFLLEGLLQVVPLAFRVLF